MVVAAVAAAAAVVVAAGAVAVAVRWWWWWWWRRRWRRRVVFYGTRTAEQKSKGHAKVGGNAGRQVRVERVEGRKGKDLSEGDSML